MAEVTRNFQPCMTDVMNIMKVKEVCQISYKMVLLYLSTPYGTKSVNVYA